MVEQPKLKPQVAGALRSPLQASFWELGHDLANDFGKSLERVMGGWEADGADGKIPRTNSTDWMCEN
jgi:hypothetical protein